MPTRIHAQFRNAIKHRLAPLLALAAIAMIAPGCGLSVDAVVRMRETLAASASIETCKQRLKAEARARKNLDKLMLRFEREHADECWRAEVMTSMLAIDQWLDCRETDRPAHARLTSLLKAEYQAPRLKDGEDSEAFYRLRAWGVHTLGKLDDPDLDEFFVSVVAADVDAGQIDWATEFAAFDALSRRTAGISANAALRNRLLALLLRLNIMLDKTKGRVQPAARDQMQHYVLFFERELKNYDAIVDLLPDRAGQTVSDEEVMVYLGWNYQYLALGTHRAEAARELFARNTATLLSLAWHENAAIRTRARIILAEFAPAALFVQAAQSLAASPILAEDCELLANIVPASDAASQQDERYRQARAFDAVFALLGKTPQGTREIVYARLLAHDPALLCTHLLSVNAQVLGEGASRMLQHIRYLRHLRKLPLDAAVVAKIPPAMAVFVRARVPAVWEQVIAELFDSEPRLLADALAPQLDAIQQENADQARYLAGAFVAVLETMEKRAITPPPPPDGKHPFDHLAPALERPELDVARTVIDFLTPRDPNRPVAVISRQIERQAAGQNKPAAVRYAMLGDLVQTLRPKLDPAVAEAGIRALATGVRSSDEDVVLLCCRYLAELKADPALWKGAAMPVSARVLLEMAGGEP